MDTRHAEICWTVKTVQETLIDAAWHSVMGASVGPRGVRSAMLDFHLTGAERLAEGWSYAIEVDEEELSKRAKRRRLSPARVSFLERAAAWPMEYLGDDPERARVLQLWLRCKVSKKKFGAEVDRVGMARATAYRQRDRALTIVSVGLDRDEIPVA